MVSKTLGFELDKYGGVNFQWLEKNDPQEIGYTVWSPFEAKTKYFSPSKQPFMINFRVENLEKLLKHLKKERIKIVGEMQIYEYGKFAWIIDPDGVKIELWEPVRGYRFK